MGQTDPMVPHVVRVREVRRELTDTFTLTLEPPPGYAFRAGQFNMLYAFGVGEAAISVSGDPTDSDKLVHTIRAVGSVTNALDRLRPGNSLGVRGPFGSCWPLDDIRGRDVILIAGGIGLAPLRPSIYHLLRHRSDYRRIVLLFGARKPSDLLYQEELHAWARQENVQVLIAVNQADTSWRGHVGFVTSLIPYAEFDAQNAVVLMCGPEIMMTLGIKELTKAGLTDDRLYLSLERNMQCAIGFCGHCQFGPSFVCMDGPVFRYDRIKMFLNVRGA